MVRLSAVDAGEAAVPFSAASPHSFAESVWRQGAATVSANAFAGSEVDKVRSSVGVKPEPVSQPPNVRWRIGSEIVPAADCRDCTRRVSVNAGDNSFRWY